MFREKKSVDVSYNRQGYIYFKSLLYKELDEREKENIRWLCRKCGGEYADALFAFVTTDKTATSICLRWNLSKRTLYRAVAKYYEMFPL